LSTADLTADQNKQIRDLLQRESASPAQWFKIMLENQEAVDRASLQMEQINGPILLVSGTLDGIWPSTMLADRIMQRLKTARHPFPDRHLAYEGAGHFIPLPNMPTTVNRMAHPVAQIEIEFGGDAEHTATAAQDAWAQIVAFLHQSLR
jgi:pimeloyl-ACP methyl ester carboxylesterase